jgi:hypothetical protein
MLLVARLNVGVAGRAKHLVLRRIGNAGESGNVPDGVGEFARGVRGRAE